MGITVNGNIIVKGDQVFDGGIKIVYGSKNEETETTHGSDFVDCQEVAVTEPEPENDDAEIASEIAGIFYGDGDAALEFVRKARLMKDTDICQYVKRLVSEKKLSDISCKKPLWDVLHSHDIYKAGYRNWASQI